MVDGVRPSSLETGEGGWPRGEGESLARSDGWWPIPDFEGTGDGARGGRARDRERGAKMALRFAICDEGLKGEAWAGQLPSGREAGQE